MEEKIISGDKKIAEFMGLRFHKIGWVDAQHIDGNYECPNLQYHYSWDWQIPAWSKLINSIKELAKTDRELYYPYYETTLNSYESAVFRNNAMQGFETIVDALEWFNQHCSKQQ